MPQNQAVDRAETTRQATIRQTACLWAAFFSCAAVAIAFFFVPAFVIRPFRYQSPRALWLALSLRQRAPLFTPIAGLPCFVFAFALWKAISRWRKALLIFILVVVTFSVVMSRLNYFEWMFHPLGGPQFLAQSQSK